MSTKTLVSKYVSDISTLRLRDAEEAGGKGANMGELVAAGLPVPPGFVLMRSSYLASMQAGGVDTELAALHREALAQVDNSARLAELCQRMQKLVTKAWCERGRSRSAASMSTARSDQTALWLCGLRQPERTAVMRRSLG